MRLSYKRSRNLLKTIKPMNSAKVITKVCTFKIRDILHEAHSNTYMMYPNNNMMYNNLKLLY
ncbi:hypothetical protein EPI10_006640 [Gossypium australe]|uniref:Uncharacterized protein n=1 Tax=Gossypium australe TaxID=47621 RepID=A0A5B6WU18_9ROSI|nr:hypothetical protein EPI10_006640 [Gossypium australe]